LLNIEGSSLRSRLAVSTGLTVAVGFLVSTAVVTYQSTRAQEESAQLLARQIAESVTANVRAPLDKALQTSRGLADSLSALQKIDPPSRSVANAILENVAQSNPQYPQVWGAWEANAFDRHDSVFAGSRDSDPAGRFMPSWTRASGQLTLESSAGYDTDNAQGDWYRLAKGLHHEAITEPVAFAVDGRESMLVSMSVPMFNAGKFAGVAGVDLPIGELQDQIAKIHPYGTGFVILVTDRGTVVADGGAVSHVGKVDMALLPNSGIGEAKDFRWTDIPNYGRSLQVRTPVSIGDTQTLWEVVVTLPKDQVMSAIVKQREIGAIFGVFGVVLVVTILMLVLDRLVLRPLGGEPSDAVAFASGIARGDLSKTISYKRHKGVSILSSLNGMQQDLATLVRGARGNAQHVALASEEIAQGNLDLSNRTEKQAAALEQTVAAMQQFSAAVKENKESALKASGRADDAKAVAAQCGTVVRDVVGTIQSIEQSSSSMSTIVGVIEAIAFQTNILALNAAVEAARAGEQGRGFSIVAAEVRSLAQRSATAAKEIHQLINVNVDRVQRGTVLVDNAGKTMETLVLSISEVANIIQGIADASEEQHKTVEQIGSAIDHLDENTQRNAALVEQSAAAAEHLRRQADELLASVSSFQLSTRV
jgi:methyl-accepting chemotaxis protein